jgi:hypothetical protein
MNKKLVFTIIAAIYGFSTMGQTVRPSGDTENNFRLASYFNSLSNKPEAITADRTLDLANIEGSMYYVEAFIPGQIYYSGKPFKTVPMRYNAYTDEIEIKRAGQQEAEALLKDTKVSCAINGNLFVYSEYRSKKGDLENGYLVEHFSGQKYKLYQKKSKAFKEGQQPKTSLHLPTPDKFVDRSGFYVAIGSETPQFFPDSRKKLSMVFEDDKIGVLKSFIKKNEIDLSKKEDVQRLLMYAETITAEGKGV